MIAAHADGATLAVRAQPGARRTGVVGTHSGALKVAVSAPPEDGRANAAVLEALKDWLGVRRSQLDLISGHANRNKVVLVRGVTAEQLQARVAARLG